MHMDGDFKWFEWRVKWFLADVMHFEYRLWSAALFSTNKTYQFQLCDPFGTNKNDCHICNGNQLDNLFVKIYRIKNIVYIYN